MAFDWDGLTSILGPTSYFEKNIYETGILKGHLTIEFYVMKTLIFVDLRKPFKG